MIKITRAEAKKKGLTRYFTGKACPRGHIAERQVSGRKCMVCWRKKRAGVVIKWKKINREKVRAAGRAYWAKTRSTCIKLLGNRCACCKETELAFLAVDHKNGGGNAHRRKLFGTLGSGGRMHLWVLREIKRVGLRRVRQQFRVLCFNCNQAFASLGYCPHKLVRKK